MLQGTRQSRTPYPHGSSRTSPKVADFQSLTAENADQMLRRELNAHQRTMAKTASYYANDRIAKGLSELPQYILSDDLFKEYGLPVSWIAPNPRGYKLVAPGKLRRWIFTVFHSLGASFDGYPGAKKGFLIKNPGARSVPVDVYGHNPRRFMAGIQYLTAWCPEVANGARGAVHFFVSRRGDFVSSVDLNDIAHGSGGDLALPFGKNVYSICFELEEHQARYIPGTNKTTNTIYRQPYPERQLLCLAIAFKKINTWRAVLADSSDTMAPYLRTREEIVSVYNARTAGGVGGFLQHVDIHPGQRTDAGAQFMIPKGQTADFGSPLWNVVGANPHAMSPRGPGPKMESGWDTLERLYKKLRGVKLATQVFKTPLADVDLALAKASTILNMQGGPAQGLATKAGRDRLAGLSRSSQMQQQTRASLYNKAAATNVALAATIGRANTVISTVIRKFDISAVKGITGAVMFNEESGTWEDGES